MKLELNRSKFVTIFALGAVSLAGCSAKVSTSSPGAGGEVPQFPGFSAPTATGASPQPVSTAATPLDGRWKLSCAAVTEMNIYTDGEVDFSGASYSTTSNMYRDAECTVAIGPPDRVSGTFTIPAAGQIDLVQNNGQLEFNVYSVQQKTLFIGLQPSSDPANRPQAVDSDLSYVYAGAAVIVK